MPRKKKAFKKERTPDPRHGSPLVTQFVNGIMRGGKRSLAESIFYESLEMIEKKSNQSGLELFQKAMNNVSRCWRLSPVVLAAPITRFLLR